VKTVIVDNFPSIPEGDQHAREIREWGDRFPFRGEVKGSHILVDPARYNCIVTSNFPVDGVSLDRRIEKR
jgi:hypothetical protein